MKGHDGAINSVCWSPDGKILASTGLDETIRLWDLATGKEIRRINSKQVLSAVFSPDSRRLVSANADRAVFIRPMPKISAEQRRLDPKELSRLWLDLGAEDVTKADRALWTLVAAQDQAVDFIQSKIKALKVDKKIIQQWIQELNHSTFAVRDKASKKLAQFDAQAETALWKALGSPLSLEAMVRIKKLLHKRLEYLKNLQWPFMPLTWWRGLAVLERIGTPSARQALALACTSPDAHLADEARAALKRLQRTGRKVSGEIAGP